MNYKDALATIAKGQVARISPLIPGIDLAGTDEDSGEEVLAHGYDLGVAHHGGYAEYARVRVGVGRAAARRPVSARQAMAIGTAGYTAARCVMALEAAGLRPDAGPVLVTGAQRRRRLDRGRHPRRARLRGRRLDRQGPGVPAVAGRRGGDLARGRRGRRRRGRWRSRAGRERSTASAARCSRACSRSLRYGGAVAACGNTGGVKLPTTVLPFILRGVSLLGVDSVQTPIEERKETWKRLAGDLRPPHLEDAIAREIGLDGLEDALDGDPERGELAGRTIVEGRRRAARRLRLGSSRATSSSRRSSSSPWPTASSSAAQNSTSVRPSRHRSSVSRRPACPESSRAMIASSRALAVS